MKLIKRKFFEKDTPLSFTTLEHLTNEAKQMEKEQSFTEQNIEDAYNAGYADAQTNHISDAKNYIHELRYIRNDLINGGYVYLSPEYLESNIEHHDYQQLKTWFYLLV